MNGKILAIFLALLFAIFLPSLSTAQAPHDYQCALDNLQRRIVIFYETGVTVPCEVHYFKDTEMPGENQVLWTATTDAGYCESKAKEFVTKLREWGWDCAPRSGAKPAQEPEQELEQEPEQEPEQIIDDTEALEPAQ